MAHFAELDDNNIVTQVIVVNNNDLLVDGKENEQKGIDFCKSLFGGNWIQTSYNARIRKNYAGIGYTYDAVNDAFIPPRLECNHAKLTLDTNTYQWVCTNEEHIPLEENV